VPPLSEERRPAITPQLALRVAVLGGIAFALFAIVFFRLWFLQVLSGEEYVSQAAQNRVRKVKIEAPRGDIVDRNGETLVRTKEAAVVQLLPNDLPEVERTLAAEYLVQLSAAERERLANRERLRAFDRRERRTGERTTKAERRERRRLEDRAGQAPSVSVPPLPRDALQARRLYRRLGKVVDMKPTTIHRRVVQQLALTPYAAVTIRTDVGRAAYNYLLERQDEFPGVRPSKTYIRDYPYRDVGAQLFGTLGEISPAQRKLRRYRGVDSGTRIGQGGIEETYDRWLRGVDGFTRVSIDAQGRPRDELPATRRDPRQGNQVKLALDVGLQDEANRAMQQAIGRARAKYPDAKAGAYVAMNPETGEIYAFGSYPSYDANLFAKPLSQEKFDELNSEQRGAPLFNRALNAGYPTGSTFKPITALAALESGELDPGNTRYNDTGKFTLGKQIRRNAKEAVFGNVDLVKAIAVSVDTYFYNLGLRLNDAKGRPLQTWARRLGLGRRTGIDLPGEIGGLVPDARWRNAGYKDYLECREKNKITDATTALFKCGGIDRSWTAGDNVSLAVGQGDLQASPLQMAVAYSGIANGGRIVRPRLGKEVEDGQGSLVQELDRPARRKVDIDPRYRALIMDGLRQATKAEGGTSAGVFKDFPGTVYGKTGTVERPPQPDQSWYAAYVNEKNRPIVVVTTVEKGGFGAETAAPAACRILAKWYDYKATCSPGGAPQ
jgi:penicillin-binding protein 2